MHFHKNRIPFFHGVSECFTAPRACSLTSPCQAKPSQGMAGMAWHGMAWFGKVYVCLII